MSTVNEEKKSCCETEPTEKKASFFERMLNKLDEKVKAKAEKQSSSDCCGGSDGKGGGCC